MVLANLVHRKLNSRKEFIECPNYIYVISVCKSLIHAHDMCVIRRGERHSEETRRYRIKSC